MRLAQVAGQVVCTVKEPNLGGFKLLVCQNFGADGAVSEGTFVAVDLVGAGRGEVVLVVEGSGARAMDATKDAAVDAAVVAIADSVVLQDEITFSK